MSRLTHGEKLRHIAVVLRDHGCHDYADYIETLPATIAVIDRYLTLHDHESGGVCGCDICREARKGGEA